MYYSYFQNAMRTTYKKYDNKFSTKKEYQIKIKQI